MITSGGNRKPAKPDRGGAIRPGRQHILPPCPSPSSIIATDPIKLDLHKIFDPVLVAGGVLSLDQTDRPADLAQVRELSQCYPAYLRSHCPEFQH